MITVTGKEIGLVRFVVDQLGRMILVLQRVGEEDRARVARLLSAGAEYERSFLDLPRRDYFAALGAFRGRYGREADGLIDVMFRDARRGSNDTWRERHGTLIRIASRSPVRRFFGR